MNIKLIKWSLFLVPALVIGGFETIRHTLMEHFLSMQLGNWITAVIDAAVIAAISRKLFQSFAKAEKELSEEKRFRAVLEERERLARVLHDQIAQFIFYCGVQVSAVQEKVSQYEDLQLEAKFNDILLSLREIDQNVRQSIFNLRQQATESADFDDRIRSYLNRVFTEGNTTWDLQFSENNFQLSPTEQVQLFGILQEAITNVIKHAKAQHVVISFDTAKDTQTKWIFRIHDNGVGFDPDSVNSINYGLDIMKNRARDIGAKLSIDSGRKGTTVTIERL